MAKKESLREYQDTILRKMEIARTSDAGQVQLLFGFRAGERNYIIGGKDVTELASPSVLEPIPVSKPWVAGAANIKGSVYNVTDFSLLMGSEPVKRGKFVVLSQDIMVGSALLVDALTGLYEMENIGLAVEDVGMKDMPPWITACYEIAGDRHYMVDAVVLSADPRFSKLQSGETQ